MFPFNILDDSSDEEDSLELPDLGKLIWSDLEISRKLPDTLRDFSQLKTNPQQINFVQKLLKKYNISKFYGSPGKSEHESNRLREIGNVTFKEKCFFSTSKTSLYEQAAVEYTKSIAYAPKGSQCLAMGYANRSAALFHLKLYKECIQDIDRAYEHYPPLLRSKIINRRNAALSLMNNRVVLQFHTPTPEMLQENKNESIDCASNAIKIEKTADACKIVATRDINAGELLAIEKSFVCYPLNKIGKRPSYLHCRICLNLCVNLIPCDYCVQELFCSESCKSLSRDLPHKYLCGMINTLNCLRGHCVQLALTLTLKIVCDQNPNRGSDANMNENSERYFSDRLDEVLKLPMNEDQMSLKLRFMLALEAGTVFQLMVTYSSVFRQSAVNKGIFKDQLLKSFYICLRYFVPINETTKIVTPEFVHVENIGTALYAFSSLFRNSCVPNTNSVMYGTTKATYAIEKIRKNDEVFSPHAVNLIAARFEAIKRKVYLAATRGYACNCVACVEEWPMNDIFVPIDSKVTPKIQLLCSQLNHYMTEVIRDHTLGSPIGSFVIGNGFSFDRLQTLMEKMILAANEKIKKPSIEYFNLYNNIYSLFLLRGNTYFLLPN